MQIPRPREKNDERLIVPWEYFKFKSDREEFLDATLENNTRMLEAREVNV